MKQMSFKTEQTSKEPICFKQGSFYYLMKENGRFIQVQYHEFSSGNHTAIISEVSSATAFHSQHPNEPITASEFKEVFSKALSFITDQPIEL